MSLHRHLCLGGRPSGGVIVVIVMIVVSMLVSVYAVNSRLIPHWRLGNGWRAVQRSDSRRVISIGIALVHSQDTLERLQKFVNHVSSPDHANYGQYLDTEKLAQMVGRSQEEIGLVRKWLRCGDNDINQCSVSSTEDYVFMRATVEQVETVFRVRLWDHVNDDTRMAGRTICRARMRRGVRTEPFVPKGLRHVVHLVMGVADLPPVPRHSTRSEWPGINVDPILIKKLYNVPAGGLSSNVTSRATSASLAEFEQAYFYESDVNLFERKYGAAVRNVTVIGINDPGQGYLGEASLDTQYMAGVTTNAPLWVFSIGPFDLVAWAQKVMSTPNSPLIHSISWGSAESGFDLATADRTNVEFMKLASLGNTLACASGDQGTGHSGFFSCGTFEPTFPAVSPYCLAVGGTYLPSSTASEVAWSGSGGGFSSYFGRPEWQDGAVQAYQSRPGLPSQQFWNKTGRGVPDVSALSTNFQVYSVGYLGSLTGTSAATPTVAAILTLINGRRVSKGKAPLGLVAPALYKASKFGQDITTGNNKDPSCPAGFPALDGWDAVTGLGTQWSDLIAALVV